MLFDGLLIEHQCRPRAVAAAGTSATIVYRNLFLSSLLGRPIQCFSLLILDRDWSSSVEVDFCELLGWDKSQPTAHGVNSGKYYLLQGDYGCE
jgi:hypothetical protein